MSTNQRTDSTHETADHGDDGNFFDMFMVVIGALIGVAVVLIFLSRLVANDSQVAWAKEDPGYTEAVLARIQPVGQVVLPGDEAAAGAVAVVTPDAAAPVETKMTGEQVYNTACFACHGAGVGGAPKLGDAGDWGPRIAQGSATLNKHALEGFQGSKGFMPAKGGRVDLSDEEVIAAVKFMTGT